MLKRFQRLWRRDRGSAIVEFALVVPIFFMVVYAIFAFGRGYSRLNALNSSIREGARKASTMPSALQHRDSITRVVQRFSSSYGYAIDTNLVVVAFGTGSDTVRVTNYPIFAGINFFGLQSITVTRAAIFRWEYGP